MTYKSVIQGFHTNSYDKCKDFIDGGFTKAIDKYWLGNGMYFWDNLGNAEYWYEEKKRKGEANQKHIVIAYFHADDLLDLSDINIINEFERLWIAIRRITGGVIGRVYLDNKTPLGVKINIILEYFEDEFDKKYKVVKGIGEYPKENRHAFLKIGTSNRCRVLNEVKVIYSIRDKSVILQREWYQDE